MFEFDAARYHQPNYAVRVGHPRGGLWFSRSSMRTRAGYRANRSETPSWENSSPTNTGLRRIAEARALIEGWRIDYTAVGLHCAGQRHTRIVCPLFRKALAGAYAGSR